MQKALSRSPLPWFLCLLLTLAATQACQPASECGDARAKGEPGAVFPPQEDRYVLTVVRSATGPTLVRTDTSTCRMWRMRLDKRKWTAISPETRSPGEGLPVQPGRFLVSHVRSRYGPMLLCNDVMDGFVYAMPMTGEGGWKQIAEPTDALSRLDRVPLSPQAEAEHKKPAPPKPPRPEITEEDVNAMKETIKEKGTFPPEMRAFAAEQLGKMKSEGTLPALIEALDDPEPAVVVAAIWALELAGDPKAIPALEKLESHEDPEVRSAAQQVIEALRE